jgi:hypothetical protein
MQITSNTTSMQAGLTVALDKHGRDHCVVVVKGTFTVEPDGSTHLAEEQSPLVYADVHHGDPATTSIKYECDFAPNKPRADIIVNGHAVSPTGEPVEELLVSLQVGDLTKTVRVVGDRHWNLGFIGVRPSRRTPFVTMPLVYERAFGGADHTHPNPKHQGAERRNPIGVGFRKNADPEAIEGTPLPNFEDPEDPIRSWSDTPAPMGFGAIGRGWQPRITFAGTYDQKWLDQRFPFLPDDFDEQYFQSAPASQQVPHLKGGERVVCTNMRGDGPFDARVPSADVPLRFRFRDREMVIHPRLDTLIIEPDHRRLIVVWRARVPLGRKLTALREVQVGRQTAARRTPGKRRYESLEALVAARRRGES